MRSKAVQIVLKSVLGAVMMAVMSKRSANTAMTSKQEEQTYCQFIEDFLNCSFRKQTEEASSGRYPNLLLLAAVPQLMHGAFISQPMQLKILGKIKDITANLGKDEGDDAIPANDSLPAVIAYVNTIIEQQVSKIEQH